MINLKCVKKDEYYMLFNINERVYEYDIFARSIRWLEMGVVLEVFYESDRYEFGFVDAIFEYVDNGRMYVCTEEKQMNVSEELESSIVELSNKMREMNSIELNFEIADKFERVCIVDCIDYFDVLHEDVSKQPFHKRDYYHLNGDDLIYQYSEQF